MARTVETADAAQCGMLSRPPKPAAKTTKLKADAKPAGKGP